MRVDTGFLRSSFAVSTEEPDNLVIDNPDPKGTFDIDTGEIALSINQAGIGDIIYGVFTASYAAPREYGYEIEKADGTTVVIPGDGFVMTNAANWQSFVDEAVLKVRASAQSSLL